MTSNADDFQRDIDELIAENKQLKSEKEELESRIEKLRCELANSVHNISLAKSERKDEINELRSEVCDAGMRLEKATTELKHVKKLLFERNRRYQEDCITINRLSTTIDVLAERMANKAWRNR
jgi:predicted RNase H-like nuclease (RuvC/YqgF family)